MTQHHFNQQCSRSTITQSQDNNHKIKTITILIMATITSQPSALAWPILHPWTPRRGFFWLAWTTVFCKFIRISHLICHLWKVAFDYFSNLESPLGPGVGSGVVLRELDSQELGQRAEGIVLGIMMMTTMSLRRDLVRLPSRRRTLHLLRLGISHFSCLFTFLATSSTFTVYFWPTLRSSPATPSWKIKMIFIFSAKRFLSSNLALFDRFSCGVIDARLLQQSVAIIPAWKGN